MMYDDDLAPLKRKLNDTRRHRRTDTFVGAAAIVLCLSLAMAIGVVGKYIMAALSTP